MSHIKPSHYNQGEIDVIEALFKSMTLEQFRGFMKGNIIKYTIRYELKNGIDDLDKAREYINRLQAYEARIETGIVVKE